MGEIICELEKRPKPSVVFPGSIKVNTWLQYHRLIEGGVPKESIVKPGMKDSRLVAYWRSC